VKFFRNGNPSDYEGDRTADGITKFCKRQSMPSVSVLDSEDAVESFKGEENVVIVGFFDSESSSEYKAFRETAETLRDRFVFGAVIGNANLGKKYEASVPSVVLFKTFDEKKNVLAGSELSTLKEFIEANSTPLIDEIGPHNYKNYGESGLPLGYVFVDLQVDGQMEKYVEVIRPIAQKTKGQLNWVYIDWQKYAKHSERLGLSGKTVPAVAIEKLQDGTHFAFDETAEITSDSVSAWVDKFIAGNLEPTIKSEEIPADNSGPVKVVVAKTFDQIVNDPSKDVLVEFYAPWCGHCKALAPIYEELGTALKDIDSVVIAKIDATANDINPKFGIRGYPTLKLFRGSDKANPVEFRGDRTKNEFIKFLKENASHKFDLDAAAGKDEL
jgi:protein disulfide-isomerase A1